MSEQTAAGWTEAIPHSLWKRFRAGHQVTFFLGAGSAPSHLQLLEEQLPTGQRMKDELLAYYYFNVPEGGRESRFREEFRVKFDLQAETEVTPEMVWTGLVSESQERLPEHISLLANLFEVNKSVPPAYRYVGWLAMNGYVRAIITTNFDEKLDQAIKDAQTQFNLRLLKDAEGNWMRRLDDWQYSTFAFSADHYQELANDPPRAVPILKLHGTLSHPSSIRAALKSIDELEEAPNGKDYGQRSGRGPTEEAMVGTPSTQILSPHLTVEDHGSEFYLVSVGEGYDFTLTLEALVAERLARFILSRRGGSASL